MPKFLISRAYVTRYEWAVEADSKDAALALLDDENAYLEFENNDTYHGSGPQCELEDRCEELTT